MSQQQQQQKQLELPSDSRQPPDGHEFPDYIETAPQHQSTADSIYAMCMELQQRTSPSLIIVTKSQSMAQRQLKTEKLNGNVELSPNCTRRITMNYNGNRSSIIYNKTSSLMNGNSVSNSDLSSINNYVNDEDSGSKRSNDAIETKFTGDIKKIHMRSRSLLDISKITNSDESSKSDRWSMLVEQRRKGLSRLKGLVIPEYISENDTITPATSVVSTIPEISTLSIPTSISFNDMNYQSNATLSPPSSLSSTSSSSERIPLPIITPAWSGNNTVQYLPAFKPKSLQTLKHITDGKSTTLVIRTPTSLEYQKDKIANNNLNIERDKSHTLPTNDASKTCNTKQSKLLNNLLESSPLETINPIYNLDSVVDSKSTTDRVLKPTSLEAINRKNILASAKCRSGKDFKVGSPVIHNDLTVDNCNNDEDMSLSSKPVDFPSINATDNNSITENNCPAALDKHETSKLKSSQPLEICNTKSKSTYSHHVDPHDQATLKSNMIKSPTISKRSDNTPIRITNQFLKKTSKCDNNGKILQFSTSALLTKYQAPKMSVTNLRKSFEQNENLNNTSLCHRPVRNITNSEIIKNRIQQHTIGKFENVKSQVLRRNAPNIVKRSSLKANTSETSATLSENNTKTIILSPEYVGGSIGITLAGGTDYEAKEITVHKIRYGSVAHKDGRLKQGDRIMSINNKSTKQLTHAECVDLLKVPVTQFVLIINNQLKVNNAVTTKMITDKSTLNSTIAIVGTANQVKPNIENSNSTKNTSDNNEIHITNLINLVKDSAGMGFSIEGGVNSPQGDLPLRVKKIFHGGPAEKDGNLNVGDELIAINNISLHQLSRIEAWSLMKKIPDGNVTIHINR